MIFIRRDRTPAKRFVTLRVGLFFLAAGLWLAGVRVGSDLVTYVAMGVAVIAIVFGAAARRDAKKDPPEGGEDVEVDPDDRVAGPDPVDHPGG